RRWGFQPNNIVTLVNEKATRENILKQVGLLYSRSAPGDEVFVYFSGHGTSGDDRDLNIPLPSESGAFIPYDIAGLSTNEDLLKKLIVGRRDLQPVFSRLDKGGRYVFVVMDACYSGNSVRGQYTDTQLPSRFLSSEDLLPNKGFGDDLKNSPSTWSNQAESNDKNAYPYEKIYYLAASGEHEPAQDIPPKMLNIYPTIDGKPHGAFTDTLLRVLNSEIEADMDQNGDISYSELKTSVRNLMRIRGFNHTPQGLPSLAEDKKNLASRGILGSGKDKAGSVMLAGNGLDVAIKPKVNAEKNNKYRVRLDEKNTLLSKALSQVKEISLVSDKADVLLKRNKDGLMLLTSGGDLVTSVDGLSAAEVADIVRRQALAEEWVSRDVPQDFSLELDLFGTGKGGTAVDGEQLGFSVRSGEKSYLLLLDIDPFGKVSVIYPYLPTELAPMIASETMELAGITQIRAPYGRDLILAYAFSTLLPEMEKVRAKSFYIDSEEMRYLESMLNNGNIRKSTVNLSLITASE
ncbi:MAG: caspase family protein, partial [Gammaproteobacteria bacterium]|nr:caspase family protein [Gammaproteobacteria bacterium]